jgi:hypothetical protein
VRRFRGLALRAGRSAEGASQRALEEHLGEPFRPVQEVGAIRLHRLASGAERLLAPPVGRRDDRVEPHEHFSHAPPGENARGRLQWWRRRQSCETRIQARTYFVF